MGFSISSIKAFCETSGVKSILQTKPQSLKGIKPAELKSATLECDTLQISTNKISAKDIIEKSKQKVKNLSQEDKEILCTFKEEYNPENLYLRYSAETGEPIKPRRLKTINALDKILDQELGGELILYRGASLKDFGLTNTIDDGEKLNMVFKKGNIISPPIYMSTSTEESYARCFCQDFNENILLRLKTKPNTKGLYVTGIEALASGKPLGTTKGLISAEKEFLINRQQPFIVDKLIDENGLKIVEGTFI